jgi:hypothetical protein
MVDKTFQPAVFPLDCFQPQFIPFFVRQWWERRRIRQSPSLGGKGPWGVWFKTKNPALEGAGLIASNC